MLKNHQPSYMPPVNRLVVLDTLCAHFKKDESILRLMKTLITAALPYANGPIHIGHLIEYIQADIIARFLRLTGHDVKYICASDTHGTPIEVNAAKLKISPEEMVNKFNKEHKSDFEKFHIKFDDYYTTHSPENRELSEYFFNTLKQNGHIYTKKIQVIYCPSCKRTLPDRYVKGMCPHCSTRDQYGDICESCSVALKGTDLIDPKCVLCGTTPIQKESEHYFFKLSAFTNKLRDWLKSNKELQPEITNNINTWLEKDLEDWCISRDGPYFGFNIPGENDKYFYVWLDAPIGYIATTKHATTDWESYWKPNKENKDNKKESNRENNSARIIHFIGKDIIYFHFLFWPAVLMGAGFNLPSKIAVHGFLTVNGTKMSKSRGTFLTAQDMLKTSNPEYLRFYYAQHLNMKLSDINLDFEDFQAAINNTLVSNLANFCYRVLSFAESNYSGNLDEVAHDEKLVSEIHKKVELIKTAYEQYDIKTALTEILNISTLGNTYFQNAEPWKNKQNSKPIVALAANIVRTLTILIEPILPIFTEQIQQQFGENQLKWQDISFTKKLKVTNAKIIFTKIEKLQIAEQAPQFPCNLRVAKVESVADHPNADSLYVVQLSLGSEKRQLVAGLKKFYHKTELEGKHVIIISNLEHAKIRGIESQGMMLAADDAEHVRVLEAPKTTPGTQVTVHGHVNNVKPITIQEFSKLGLKVLNGKVVWKESHLHTTNEDIVVTGVENGAVVR